ncbi:hypothetical protein AB0I28_30475 [Phytomonospora sp. NPDC050363]|uniref:hypothetical protein n=1 Tax=Phytomonospora sp. NPDC050363 TaxID=3155642 RepID=UPI0033D2210E
MSKISRLTDRMLSVFVPKSTAAAGAGIQACYTEVDCRVQECGSRLKMCFTTYCNGVYHSGSCNGCGSC